MLALCLDDDEEEEEEIRLFLEFIFL